MLIPYVESVVGEYFLNRKDQKTRCLLYVFAAHRTDSFKDKLDDNDIQIRFSPASYTGELQPLDVAGNDEFKRKIKNSFINWYSDELTKKEIGKSSK